MEMFDNTGGANGITRQSRMLGLFIWGDEDKVFYLTPPPWCLDHLDQPKFIVIVFHKQLPGEPRHFSFPCWECRDLVWICLREFLMNEWYSPAERDRESQLIRRWLTPSRLRGISTKTLLLGGTGPREGFFCSSPGFLWVWLMQRLGRDGGRKIKIQPRHPIIQSTWTNQSGLMELMESSQTVFVLI